MPFHDAELDRLAQMRDITNRLLGQAKTAHDDAFNRYQTVRSINGPRIDALKNEHDRLFAEANVCSSRSQNAFMARDHDNAAYWSRQARELRDRLPSITAEKRRLVDAIRGARDDFDAAKAKFQAAKTEHERASAAFQARLEQLKRDAEQQRASRGQDRQREWLERKARVESQKERLGRYAVNAYYASFAGTKQPQHLDPDVRVTVRNNWNRDHHVWTTDVIVAPRDHTGDRLHIVFDERGNEIVNEWHKEGKI